MKGKKTSELIRKATRLRLLLPCVLVAMLVIDGLLGYTMPDFSENFDVAPQKVYAAEAPKLEDLAQTAERAEAKGPAGRLAKVDESGDYKDGEYTGSAKGFGGKITVRVTIKDGKITSIKIISAPGETGSFFARAKAVVGAILKKQSTNVDAVSGATYSSNGIIKAVRNALAKAEKKNSGKKRKTDDKDDNGEDRKPVRPDVISEGNWKDGTYTGEGEGFGGKLHVQVTIENGKISAIELLDSMDGEEFISKAKAGVFTSVMQKQGTDVDSVTGATFSSYGLVEAINDALKRASSDTGDETADDTGEAGGSGTDSGDGSSDKVYKDGTYTQTVMCTRDGWFDYDIIITLTVKDGRINTLSAYKGEDFTEDEHYREDNDGYLDMAANGYGSRKGVISRILDSQSADVDAVTGATYSSSAIKNGVAGILSGIVTEKKKEVVEKPEDKDAVNSPGESEDETPSEAAETEEEAQIRNDSESDSDEMSADDVKKEENETADDSSEQEKKSNPPHEDAAAADDGTEPENEES